MAQIYAPDDILNSSDQEYEVAVRPHFRAGLKSIESMHKSRNEDRFTSKKRLRELDDARGAPGTVYHRELWLNRLENYARSINLVFDPVYSPTADTLIRFLDTIVTHIEVRLQDKPAPQFRTIRAAFQKLESALIFKYPEFKLSAHNCARLDALFAKLAKEKKLLRGRWRKRQWLGANILEKMSRSWLRLGLDVGCSSWDVHLQKLLSVVMLSALGCRSGELALSGHYTEEYMRWEHITLKLEKGGNTMDDVQASILLAFEKNKKLEIGDDRSVPLKALRHPSLNFICPIKLLLIQALRSGNLGPSLDEILLQTSLRVDRTVQWNFPDRPVFPAMQKPAYTFLDWDKAVGCQQLRKTTIQIGSAAGVLANVTSHDWRRGYARDMANTKRSTKIGVADDVVAKTLGQSHKSFGTGVTDDYVGDIELETYTGRAEDLFEGRTQPAFGEPYRKARVTSKEIDDYCSENGINATSKTGRSKAAHHLRAKHKSDWMMEQKNAPISSLPVPTLPTSSEMTLSKENLPKKRKSGPPISSQSPLVEMSTQAAEARSNPANPNATSQMLPITKEFLAANSLGVLDPRLFLDSMDTLEVDDAGLQRFESFLVGDPPEPTEQETDDALDLLVENMVETDDMLTIEPHKFVDFFSKINIVRNSALVAGAKLPEKLVEKVPMGNTRDYPTLYLFNCSLCNNYKCTSQWLLEMHELTCKPRGEKLPTPFQCPHEGCGKSFESETGLQTHISRYHDWPARMCATLDCSDKVFRTMRAWAHHLATRHNPLETPTRCAVPECKSVIVWETYHSYTAHLRNTHKLVTATSRKPYISEHQAASHWPVGQCPIGGTKNCGTTFKARSYMMRHLTAEAHKLTNKDANMVANQIESQMYVLVNVESQAHGENNSDEDGGEDEDKEGEEGIYKSALSILGPLSAN